MARAQGARAQMALAYETVYGTPPVSGFRLMPFARATLGSEQPLLESELLGYGRDPLALLSDECEPVSVPPTPSRSQAASRPRHSARAAARVCL